MKCKDYGKAKIYLANQDNFDEVSNDELAKLDAIIKEKKDKLTMTQNKAKAL